MADGKLTARAARYLIKALDIPGYEILFDHGDPLIDPPSLLGNISSWFSDEYSSKSQLALLDIAVVETETDRALVLVEIEETSSSPKVILGDLFGTLMGDHVTFQGRRELRIGDHTSFIILVADEKLRSRGQIEYIQEEVEKARRHMESWNNKIGRVIVDLFQDEGDLFQKLKSYVDEQLGFSNSIPDEGW
jgi:hypothetical protein